MTSFEKLIHSAKFQKQWGRAHAKFSGANMGFEFENGLQILEDILNHGDCVLNEDCFLFKKGEPLRRSYQGRKMNKRFSSLDAFSRQLIRAEVLHQGASLKIDQAGRFSPVINQMVQRLSHIFGVAVSCNLYFTPAFSKCFAPHTDPYHIFILQLAGKKYWNIKKPSGTALGSDAATLKEVSFDFADILKEGDLFYLPEGSLHEAYTKEQLSLHLTFGLHPIRLNHYLAATFDNAAEDPMIQMSSQILLSQKPNLFLNTALTPQKIEELTKEFKKHLLGLQKKGTQSGTLKDQLDLESSLQLPSDLEIYPDTRFQFRKTKGISGILREESSPVRKALQALSRKKQFFAGELTELVYPELSWQQTFQILRKLIEKSVLQIKASQVSATPKDPFAPYARDFKKRDLYYFRGERRSLRVFKVGEEDGYLKMTAGQAQSLLESLSEGAEILDQLCEKFANEHHSI